MALVTLLAMALSEIVGAPSAGDPHECILKQCGPPHFLWWFVPLAPCVFVCFFGFVWVSVYEVVKDQRTYSALLTDLIVQGALTLLEPEIKVPLWYPLYDS